MKILIIGGTGTIGYQLAQYYKDEELYIMSRDEEKQWRMKLKHPNIKFYIGDIRDYSRTLYVITQSKPDIIIIAAAMKHVDICEVSTHECIHTNILGIKNVLDVVQSSDKLTVCYISSDKACNPVNIYGMSKAIGEIMMIEKSITFPQSKFVTVRYGNVINSRGSILQTLDIIGNSDEIDHFTLTHPDMERFVMTKEQSVQLIDYAIKHGESGDIIIPELVCMKIQDLMDIFSEKYKKPVKITGLRPGEKIVEHLINETQLMKSVKKGKYIHVKREMVDERLNIDVNYLSKDEIKILLE
jgi:UDP-glucose 4-epimerase